MAEINLDNIASPANDPLNKACHDICINLFNQLKGKQITLQEFLKEIAYTALRYGFDELVPRQMPQRIAELVEYDNLSLQEKMNIKSEFWRQSHIANYLDTCQKVKFWNKHTKEWLKEIANYIPQDDYSNQQKIKNRLQEFSNPLIDKLTEQFNAETV